MIFRPHGCLEVTICSLALAMLATQPPDVGPQLSDLGRINKLIALFLSELPDCDDLVFRFASCKNYSPVILLH